MNAPQTIDAFRGEYEFLSNFYPSNVVWEDVRYPTVEHAYQAAKTTNPDERLTVARMETPGRAKRAGQRITLRDGWERGLKLTVMRTLVHRKFEIPELRAQLLATGDAQLIEGNTWGDQFWGVCRGKGQNWLGRILMEARASIRDEA